MFAKSPAHRFETSSTGISRRDFSLKCGVALAAALSAGSSRAQQAKYRFSPVNQWDIEKTASYWNPIIHHVSRKSGVGLELKIGRTSADTTAYVLAQEVEFVFSNHLFSPQRKSLGWKVFGRRNAPMIRAQIVVPDASPIRTLADLAGQDVAFAGNEAFIGYKVPMAELYRRKISVKPVFSGNQNGAFAALFAGRAQAVGSNSMLVDGYAAREKKSFRVLWTSDAYHDLALMVASKVPDAHVRSVADAFLSMKDDAEGQRILASASTVVSLSPDNYFVPATMDDFQNYVTFFESAPIDLH